MRGDARVAVPLVAPEVAAVVRLAVEHGPRVVDARDHVSRALMVYLKRSGSRLSRRLPPTSACGYIRNGSGFPFDPGSVTSCASLKAIQLPSHDPNNVSRAFATYGSEGDFFSSRITLRTSAGSTGIQPNPSAQTSARQCCAVVTFPPARPRLGNCVDGATRRP